MSPKYLTKNFLILLCAGFLSTAAHGQMKAKLHQTFKVEGIIWGFDFVDQERVVYTIKEKGLFLYEFKNKKHSPLATLPDVHIAGQGGYLDIKLHPEFAKNKKVVFSYSKKTKKGATTAVAVGLLENSKISDIKEIFVADAETDEDIHFGGRILFENNDAFFVSIGDRNARDESQNLKKHNGKIMRVQMDGTFKMWSYGHRNPQGLSFFENQLWSTEFGPRGGDELNKIVENGNYGWPKVTKGREYWGPKIGTTSMKGMIDPVISWVPSISPSGLHCYQGEEKFFQGKCLLANLSGEHIRVVDPKNIDSQQELLKELNLRFRQIGQDTNKTIYVSTDEGIFGYLQVTPIK